MPWSHACSYPVAAGTSSVQFPTSRWPRETRGGMAPDVFSFPIRQLLSFHVRELLVLVRYTAVNPSYLGNPIGWYAQIPFDRPACYTSSPDAAKLDSAA